jgi:hypothetical protein
MPGDVDLEATGVLEKTPSAQHGPRRRQRAGAKQISDENRPQAKNSPEKPPKRTIDFSYEDVVAAVESLYVDELKPFGRILRKRVAENAAANSTCGAGEIDGEDLPDVDSEYLRTICLGSPDMRVESEPGGDWSALIIGRQETFVDIYSSCDNYPAEMWQAAAAYFERHDVCLPGGRYACAQRLYSQALPFLDDCSLGQISHIIQLAVSQKKILGYADGSIVPYAKSQSFLKDQCAKSSEPCVKHTAESVANPKFQIADWETARHYLQEMLRESSVRDPQGLRTVPLSNVKRLFKSKYNVELSETTLGHSKLTELLQDIRFSDICTVELQKHGYIVVEAQSKESARDTLLADSAKKQTPIGGESRRMELSAKMNPLPEEFDNGASLCSWLSSVQRTFIHASLPPPTPPPHTRPRSHSLPRSSCFVHQSWSGLAPTNNAYQGEDYVESNKSTADSDEGSFVCSAVVDIDDNLHGQVLKDIGPLTSDIDRFTLGDAVDSFMSDTIETLHAAEDLALSRHSKFCLDEPLVLEESPGQAFRSILVASTPNLETSYIDDINECGPTPSVYNGYSRTPNVYANHGRVNVGSDLVSLSVHMTPSPSPVQGGKYYPSAFNPPTLPTSLLPMPASVATPCPTSTCSVPAHLENKFLQLADLPIQHSFATMPMNMDNMFWQFANVPMPLRCPATTPFGVKMMDGIHAMVSPGLDVQIVNLASALQ